MKTNVQNLAKSQIELKIEVPAEEFQGFVDKAVLSLGETVEIEGFRKGKAPKEMVEKHVSQSKIWETAAEICIKEAYVKAVTEQKLEPLGQPAIDILKLAPGNPFEFKAKISVLPQVTLPDYRKIASQVKKQEVKVSTEEIEKLRQEKERIEKERLRQEILGKIAQQCQIDIPEILVQSEEKRLLENLKGQVLQMLGMDFEEYLKKINKTEKELLDSFAAEAQKRVKNSLVLREIEKQEKIEVPEKELADEMAKIGENSPGLDKHQLKDYTESAIRNEKTLQLLEGLTG